MTTIGTMLAAFEALPLGTIQVLAGRTPLILAPHPDDESLGCGGLIAACCAAGQMPLAVFLTDGAASHPGSATYPPAQLAATREAEALAALQHLGLPPERIMFLRFPDREMPRLGEDFDAAVRAVVDWCSDETIVIGPWQEDPHCDHEAGAIFAQAVAAGAGTVLWSYPVWGWLRDPSHKLAPQRLAGFRLDISAFQAAKQRAIATHASQSGEMIKDAPNGFRLPPDLLDLCARPYEVFFWS
jgi:LmbE family N-acetylglucosaminyl deacetylase